MGPPCFADCARLVELAFCRPKVILPGHLPKDTSQTIIPTSREVVCCGLGLLPQLANSGVSKQIWLHHHSNLAWLHPSEACCGHVNTGLRAVSRVSHCLNCEEMLCTKGRIRWLSCWLLSTSRHKELVCQHGNTQLQGLGFMHQR